MELISVIIPLYNAELFVEKAYSFIVNQKMLKIPIEIIFVDNNSKDKSFEFAKNISEIDARVQVYREKIQGAPAARNTGFLKSKGDFVYFFDVDDQLFDDSIASLVNVLIENQNYDAVFGKLIRSDNNIELLDRKTLKEDSKIIFNKKPYWGLLWFQDLSKTVGPPGFLYRRAVFEELGMYNTKIPGSEDTALDIKLGMGYNIAKINKYIYLYFKHPNATTTQTKKVKSRAFMQWPRIIHSHIPFYLENRYEKEYYEILKIKIYASIAKMIHTTKGVKQREEIRQNLLKDIQPMKLPVLLKLYTQILVLIDNDYILKFYLYYLLPFYTKKVSIKT
jgi:glycosyltransferase involved in cell wall biosynthesis